MMHRYTVAPRFGGRIEFFDNIRDADLAADKCFGFVFDNSNVPATTAYDASWDLTAVELEDILSFAFPGFMIRVESGGDS